MTQNSKTKTNPRQMNPYRIVGDVVYMAINRKSGPNLECVFDLADLDLVLSVKATWVIRKHYASCMTSGDSKKKCVLMHRLVMDAPHGFDVDHMNHNGLDSRKVNLRVVRRTENVQNSDRTSSASGCRNVCFDKHRGQYRVLVRVFNKTHFGGWFDRLDDAVKAAKALRIRVQEFCPDNTPSVPEVAR